MTWGKIRSKTDKGNREFRCSLKTETMTSREVNGNSLLKTGLHKEINLGVSFLNLLNLKITQTRKNLQPVFHHGLNPNVDHFCSANNCSICFVFLFFKKPFYWPLKQKSNLCTSRGFECQCLEGKFKAPHNQHGLTQHQHHDIWEMPRQKFSTQITDRNLHVTQPRTIDCTKEEGECSLSTSSISIFTQCLVAQQS